MKILSLLILLQYQPQIDSLTQALQQASTDTNKVLLLLDLSWAHRNSMPQKSIEYGEAAYRLAVRLHYNKGITQSLTFISVAYRNMGKYRQAMGYLEQVMHLAKNDGDKDRIAYTYQNMGSLYTLQGNYPAAVENLLSATKIAEEINNEKLMGYCYINIARVFVEQKSYTEALSYHQKALAIRKRLNDRYGTAVSLYEIGMVLFEQEKNDEAKKHFNQSIAIMQVLGQTVGIADNYKSVGSIFAYEGQIDSAFIYYQKALHVYQTVDNTNGVATVSNLLAKNYFQTKHFDSALFYGLQSFRISKTINSLDINADASRTLSNIYEALQQYKLAFEYQKRYQWLNDTLLSIQNTQRVLRLEMQYNFEKDRTEQQIKYLRQETEMNNELQRQKLYRNLFIGGAGILLLFALLAWHHYRVKRLANQQLEEQNFEITRQNLEIQRQAEHLRHANDDILFKNHELEQQKEEIQTQAEHLQQANDDIMLKNHELEQQKEEIQAQAEKLEQYAHELELLSIVASETDNAVVIMDAQGNFMWFNQGFTRLYGYTSEEFRAMYSNVFESSNNPDISEIIQNCIKTRHSVIYETLGTTKSGEELWVQTTITPIMNADDEVEKLIAIDSDIRKLKQAENEIRIKSDQITGSIRYASRIQQAILPAEETMNQYFDTFLLYRPKDIVSGDFYWFTVVEQDDTKMCFAAVVDCTGHGVPGAFMSMIGNRLLNEIVIEQKVYEPHQIIEQLNISVINALHQEQSHNNDGMDIALIRIDKPIENQSDTLQVLYAGAKNDLYCYQKASNELIRLEATRLSLGGWRTPNPNITFTTKQLQVAPDDVLYMYSDGIIDQNNSSRKKFGHAAFRKLLAEHGYKPMQEQLTIFEATLDEWQQNTEQRDDITVMGLRII